MVFRICFENSHINTYRRNFIFAISWKEYRDIHITMSVHSWTLSMMTVRPCGIQDSSTVAARIDSQQTYRPLAAVYSSCTRAMPIQKDISQRPTHTDRRERGGGKNYREERKTTVTYREGLFVDTAYQAV